MSTKDLFNRNYLKDSTEKDAFSDIESSKNAKAVKERQDTFLPPVNYANPFSFAKFGSARLYYDTAISRILNFYPYDGSEAELNEFYNKSLDIEKYIFNSKYPRTNGYAIFSPTEWGSATARNGGYGSPSTNEYITFKAGPNSISQTQSARKLVADTESSKFQYSNIYDDNLYVNSGLPSDYGSGTRTSNLKSNFDTGVTVEFWAKTGSLATSLTEKQVVFDMWNNELSSSAHYGRLTIELNGTASASTPWLVTVESGSTNIFQKAVGTNLTIDSLSDWRHYSFVLQNSGSDFHIKLYVNGELDDTEVVSSTTINELNPENMMGRIGALQTAPRGLEDASKITNFNGAGKLSGSIDEFRFWKVARNAKEVGQNWFTQIRGGVNTDISNTTLGMYYKFNEGITNSSSLDSVVLDYGGRICNGVWTGYTAPSRNTGSAIVSASAASSEYLDPIIYSGHPDVVSLKSELQDLGVYHDSQNNGMFLKNVPSWILEEAEAESDNLGVSSDLERLTHIIGAYFDKLYLQIQAIPKLRHSSYLSASNDPFPFSKHLPESLGLYTPEIFIDSDIIEKFANRNDKSIFDGDLNKTKNVIYQNIYNNLASIFKSKGTEKSIRNVLRCFNIDDNLIYLSAYSNNQIIELRNNLKQTQKKRRLLNLNKSTSTTAVVYQAPEPSNIESRGFISGSGPLALEDKYGFTLEVGVKFPKFIRLLDDVPRSNINTASIFGLHSASVENPDQTTIFASDVANFQVHAIRDSVYSKNIYFKLSSSVTPFPIPLLTTSLFYNVYDDENWNLSVGLRPPRYPFSGVSSGSADADYKVVFRGYNNKLGTINNQFELTASVPKATGQSLLRAAKRVYIGATNENITGSNNTLQSDVLFNNTKYWTQFIDSYTLKQHAVDRENFGISGSYRNIDATLIPEDNQSSFNFNTLALNWYFDSVTGSDASGEFYVTDLSSGSALIRDNFGWAGRIAGHAHTGRGTGFSANDPQASIKQIVNEFKFIEPEQATSSDMVKILSDDDELFGTFEQIPNYVFAVEKSLYRAVSEEILDFFAGSIDFNNLIGNPVNRYRKEYKDLDYLRRIFFERVNDISTVEKYIDYYKWFDDSLATIISQLVPVSAEFINDTYNTIESHVLERNKYQSQFPTIDFKQKDPAGSARGIVEAKISYQSDLFGGVSGSDTNIPQYTRPTNMHVNFWQRRALPGASGIADPEITSSNAVLDTKRRAIREIKWSNPVFSASMPTLTQLNGTKYTLNRLLETQKHGLYEIDETEGAILNNTVRGGVNFATSKNIHYTYTSLHPAGPVYISPDGLFIPQNILLAETEKFDDVESDAAFNQSQNSNVGKKRKRYLKVTQGRDYVDGNEYTCNKNSIAFPFNVMSASIKGGIDDYIRARTDENITIANLHNDAYGDLMEVPMQGPFTDYAVGGHQSRHVGLNISSSIPEANFNGLDNYLTRPEAWKLLLGKRDPTDPSCDGTSAPGAIGMTAPDYPWPEANDEGVIPYPLTGAQKAVYYRDHVAKRPVNIRNIQLRTGSTILGNYQNNYEVVHTFGAFENPRQFIENQPQLPVTLFQLSATSSTQGRTFLDVRRTSGSHFEGVADYNSSYTSGTVNKTVIVSRFDAVGGMLTSGRGYTDIRSGEFSVYNRPDLKNFSVTRPSQISDGQTSEPIGSGTAGIRVSDIHGLDFGLRSHSSRHTARFGRDSSLVTNPGASYDELPGYHKIHRNNRHCVRIATDTPTPVYEGDALHNTQGAHIQGGNGSPTFVLTASHDASSGKPATRAPLLLNSITGGTGNGFTWTGTLKFHIFEGHTGNQIIEPIWSIGVVNSSTEFVQLRKVHASSGDNRHQIHFRIASVGADAQFYQVRYDFPADTFDLSGNFNHIALTYNSIPDGKLLSNVASQAVTLYLNGVSQSYAAYESIRPDYRAATGTKTSYRNFASFTAFDSAYMNIGGDLTAANFLSASVDEFTFWTTELNADEISEIYNGGVPCDITSSAVYAASASALWDWIRFESTGHEGASYMQLHPSNPGTFISANSLIGYLSSSFTPMAVNTAPLGIVADTSVPAGCTPVLVRYDDVKTFATQSMVDNFFIQHQIPQMDKQYAWLTRSLVSDNGICGFYRPDFMRRVTSSAGTTFHNAFDFVSASEIKAFTSTGANLAMYKPAAVTTATSLLPQTTRLNLIVEEPITASSNTLGWPLGTPLSVGTANSERFLNFDLVPLVEGTLAGKLDAPVFNTLMHKRGNQFGYPSWKQVRQQDHQILTQQKLNNELNIFTTASAGQLSTYDLRPVAMVGRYCLVNLDYIRLAQTRKVNAEGQLIRSVVEKRNNVTLKTSYNNEYVLFNDKRLNDYANINFDTMVTPFEQLVSLKDRDGIQLNWVLYRENVYPAIRNEFATYANKRVGYDSGFWKGSLEQRVTAGEGIPNSVGVVSYNDFTINGNFDTTFNTTTRFITQSIFPLDAPLDFETRTGPPKIAATVTGSSIVNLILSASAFAFGVSASEGITYLHYTGSSLIGSNSAGELQNTYTMYHFNSASTNGIVPLFAAAFGISTSSLEQVQLPLVVRNGALYSRKHLLVSPKSYGHPAGVHMSGSQRIGLHSSASTEPIACHLNYATTGSGEAKWEAPTQAGYITKSMSTGTFGQKGFVSAPSKPFYDEYDQFKQDIKLAAKGYSVLPEFRISEHIQDYVDLGITNNGKTDTFEIPGTQFSSSQENFYKDFSNSDFLEHFADVRQLSDLTANQIKLSCRAAIKFHPYKGFYPAQRALDLVSQFSRSFSDSISSHQGGSSIATPALIQYSYARPVMQPLFAPGILFNSIKSGLAVDYPIVTDNANRVVTQVISSSTDTTSFGLNYIIGTTASANDAVFNASNAYMTGAFWDERIPFEAIIDPSAHMRGLIIPNIEPHLSVSFDGIHYSASIDSGPTDNLYTLMASNYFAEVGKFFLKDNQYTKLSSNGVNFSNVKFPGNEVYGARLKIRTSFTGSRSYEFESGSTGNNVFYGQNGAKSTGRLFGQRLPGGLTASNGPYEEMAIEVSRIAGSGTYEIPQDPVSNPNFKRSFSMYSRATAFGPPISGRNYFNANSSNSFSSDSNIVNQNQLALSASEYGTKDSLEGHNWSFTPPYYDGEAWVDFIFRPSASVAYDLERILAETQIITRRFDPGESIGTDEKGNIVTSYEGYRTLVLDKNTRRFELSDLTARKVGGRRTGSASDPVKFLQPYSGENINSNAMQLNSSINLFGVENVFKTQTDKFGNEILSENEIIGKKWVIQPKFETPMLNFSDTGIRPISAESGTLTLPQNYGADTVPRGMWHQFGIRPENSSKGIFLEIADIPRPWLKNHYEVIGSASIYNNFDGPAGQFIYKDMKSFSDLMGFTQENSKARLGELGEKQVIREAVVAVPYVLKGLATGEFMPPGEVAGTRKEFISIPDYRVEAALASANNSAAGDSLDAAGTSIRRQIEKMQRYVLPPQLDFLNVGDIDPLVMYIFEFEYKLDKDDLSYVWQNLAPRNYSKFRLEEFKISHELINTELLNEKNLHSTNLRWMVFKVKQKSQASYQDAVVDQFNQPTTVDVASNQKPDATTNNYKLRFNWPYDYVSIVESVVIDTDVLYKDREPPQEGSSEFILTPEFDKEDLAGKINESLDKSKRRTKKVIIEAKRSEAGSNARDKNTSRPPTGRPTSDPRKRPPTSEIERRGGNDAPGRETDAGEAGGLGGGTSGLGGRGENSGGGEY